MSRSERERRAPRAEPGFFEIVIVGDLIVGKGFRMNSQSSDGHRSAQATCDRNAIWFHLGANGYRRAWSGIQRHRLRVLQYSIGVDSGRGSVVGVNQMVPGTALGHPLRISATVAARVPPDIACAPMSHRSPTIIPAIVKGHVGAIRAATTTPGNDRFLVGNVGVQYPRFYGTGWIRSHQGGISGDQRSTD